MSVFDKIEAAIEVVEGWSAGDSLDELERAYNVLIEYERDNGRNNAAVRNAAAKAFSPLQRAGRAGTSVGPQSPDLVQTGSVDVSGREPTVVRAGEEGFAPSGASTAGGPSGGGAPQTGDPSLDSAIAHALSGIEGTGQLEPIGGFFKEPTPTADQFPGIPGPIRDFQQSQILQDPYYEGDEFTLLRDMPEEQLVRLQDTLVTLGLAPDVIPGELDDNTLRGFSRLLAMSNRNGERWSTTVSRLERAIEAGEFAPDEREFPGFVEPTRLEPDPARIREEIRQFGEQRLGRELQDAEVEHLQKALLDLERDDFGNMVAEERAIHDATIQAQVTGEDQTVEGDFAEHGSGVVASQFSELFRERYKPETDRRGRVEIGQVVGDLVRGGTGNVGRMTGGV